MAILFPWSVVDVSNFDWQVSRFTMRSEPLYRGYPCDLALPMNDKNALRSELRGSPILLPLDMNRERVQLVRCTEAEYRSAAFLDNRAFHDGRPVVAIDWKELLEQVDGLPIQSHFIFHISHTGSTLVSRILGEHPQLLSLREPTILRRLTQPEFSERLQPILALLSRTHHPQQRALIKATSFVSEIGCQLMWAATDARALLMTVQPESFLCALLRGPMSDIASSAVLRLNRLQQRGMLTDVRLVDLAPAECVAMSWLAEMVTLAEIADQFPTATLWLDFDNFLDQPREHLAEICSHFRVEDRAASLAACQWLTGFSKKTESLVDRAYRQRMLAEARKKLRGEITVGMRWIESNAKSFQCGSVSI